MANFGNGTGEMQLVTFRLNDEHYGVDILAVQEIIRMNGVTLVANSPDFVEGIISLRGTIIPIVDLRTRFGMPKAPPTVNTRIIVLQIEDIIAGLVVDQVSEVLRIGAEAVDEAPAIIRNRVAGDFIRGVGKLDDRLLVLLDVYKLFNEDESGDLGSITEQTEAA